VLTVALAMPAAAVAVAARFAVAFVFLFAALPKLAAPAKFLSAVENYDVLPDRFVAPVASWLPRLELLSGALLILGVGVSVVGLAAALLLGVFSLAVAVNLARGRSFDCGCGTSGVSRQIGWNLVAADLVLAAMALVAAVVDPAVLELKHFSFLGTTRSFGRGDAVAILITVAISILSQSLVAVAARLRHVLRSRPV
jgi:putative oxidoreductase